MVGHSNAHEMFPMPVWLRVIVTKSRRIARYVKDIIVIQFMPATNYPVIREAFEIEQSDDKRMIVFKLYGLRIEANSSSSFILGLCNGGRSTREIITVIANEFDMPRHVIGRHVRMLIRQLLKSRLVVLYSASSPPPFVVLPTGTVIKREVEAAVRFRMGRFYEQTNPFDDTLLESHFNNHLLLKFSRGKLIYKNNSNHSDRSNWFIDSLNKLNIPLADFWVIFTGHDGADNHHTIPIYGQSRVTGSDSTILWPLKGYTTIESKNFGQDIDKSDCDWKQKKAVAFWRGATTGISIYNMTENNINFLINNPLTITNPSTGVIIDKANRLQLVNKFFNDKDMNIGLSSFAQIDKMAQEVFCKKGFLKQRASFEEILFYKYLIVVDGNDFASQLPWSLHSRSLVLMVPPAYETTIHGLTAWEHYVPLASDFSDLKEKIEWCRQHDSQCYGISRSATDLMRSHYNTQHEHMIQQLMIERYAENFPSL